MPKLPIAAAILSLLLGAEAPSMAATCTGDCNGSGSVTIEELVLGVGIALGSTAVVACPAFDANSSGGVTVEELVAAVGAALDGCPATATPEAPTLTPAAETPTSPPNPTRTPTAPPEATATSEIPSPTTAPSDTDTPTPTATPTATSGPFLPFCDLPGSVQFTEQGTVVIPGGGPDLTWLRLPVGFCAHYYGSVGNVRQLRVAPGGELFAASPSTLTTGGRGDMGLDAIVVLPDDDRDGFADTTLTFLHQLPSPLDPLKPAPLASTQGLMFANGFFYFQDHTRIMRVPYAAGDRAPSGAAEVVVDIGRDTGRFEDPLHWPKPLDIADDGTIYVGNGGTQSDPCQAGHPFRGGILKVDGTPGGAEVAKGFRNPIAVRCARGFNRCFAIELARDYSANIGGREKLVPIREGDDWGHPCCATANQPYPGITPVPDCSEVDSEGGAFVIGHTPFDLDFAPASWPPPWNNRVYVPMHGVYSTWEGARVLSIGMDPVTGDVLMGSELPAQDPGSMLDFAGGWDDGPPREGPHGRPANITFAPDGRMFLGNDNTGDIIWIAPLGR